MKLPHETKGGTIGAGLSLIVLLSLLVHFWAGSG